MNGLSHPNDKKIELLKSILIEMFSALSKFSGETLI